MCKHFPEISQMRAREHVPPAHSLPVLRVENQECNTVTFSFFNASPTVSVDVLFLHLKIFFFEKRANSLHAYMNIG